MTLPPFLVQARDRVNAMSLRERLLVMGLGVAVLLVAWQALLMDPLDRRREAARRELAGLAERLATLEQGEAAARDPLAAAIERERSLQGELERVQAELGSSAASLVAPQAMPGVLRGLLEGQRGLTLVSLEKLPPEDAAPAGATARGPFVQPVALVIEGNYGSIVEYLRTVEGQEVRFLWRSLDLQTADWPRHRVRLELGTLSLGPEWIAP